MRDAFTGHSRLTVSVLLGALALRLFFALACPHVAGDSSIYESFATNLLKSGTYSHLQAQEDKPLRPTLLRVPGYPLFLAAVFAAAGTGNETAVRVTQAVLDTFTCILIALIVFEISAGEERRRRKIAQLALLLAALCPFIANYAATILTEAPATLLWTAATLFGLRGLKQPAARRNWFYAGLLTGTATLFRPESGILAGIFGLVLFLREILQRHRWKAALLSTTLMVAGLLLVLIPWTVRNAWTLKTFQMLAPTHAQDAGERVPTGYLEWCRTWLWTYRDVGLYWFPLEAYDLPEGSLPAGRVDNETQRRAVLGMMERHNLDGDNLSPQSDSAFAFIAGENRRHHPFRFYVVLPVLRSLAMWFTPRIEILGYEGNLFPIKEAWRNDRVDFSISLFLFAVNIFYIGFAALGAASVLRRTRSIEDFELFGLLALLIILIMRTGFFAFFSFPEPRYVLETYSSIIVLAAFAFWRNRDVPRTKYGERPLHFSVHVRGSSCPSD
jgi:4-amino-4-deoxy-L-arabinose transferase-like glycosyltransferase